MQHNSSLFHQPDLTLLQLCTYESLRKNPPNNIKGSINGGPRADAPSTDGDKLDMTYPAIKCRAQN